MITLLASALLTAATWAPLVPPEPVLVVEGADPHVAALTEVVAHDGGFAALRPGAAGWELLASPDGRRWESRPIEGTFAATGNPVALTTAGDDLLAFEATPALVMWRSTDGTRWERTDLGNPWPAAAAGLRIVDLGVDVSRIGDLIHVRAGISAHADWEALLGVPDHLVVPTVSGATLNVQVTSGDRKGTYQVRLTAEANAVALRLIASGGQVMGERRLAPITDPEEFVQLFIACGGFSPMHESWWFEADGMPVEPPEWLAQLGHYPVVATGTDATLRVDEYGRVLRLAGDGGWETIAAPTSLVHTVLASRDRVLLVGEEPATGLTIWELAGDDWRQLPAPAVDGHWLAAAVPSGGGAVVVYDSDGRPDVAAVVVGGNGRARTYRLPIPDWVRSVTIHGDTAVVHTERGDGDTVLWSWRIERPESARPIPR